MPTADPYVPGGAVTGGAVVAGGAVSAGPLELGGHQPGAAFRTAWDATAPAGTGTEHFTFVQADPQSVITVEHRLGFRPQVSLFSLDYSVKYRAFGVQHLDLNRLRISMDRPTPVAVVIS